MRLAILALLVLGTAYRFVYVFDQIGRLDGDNAVVALMARHILAGRHYAFFWGQSYMGALEPYSIAGAAAVFGLNDVVLRAVPLVWSMLYVATFYPLTRLLFGRREAIVAIALAALPPPLLAVWGPSPRGGYSTMLFLGHTLLILAILLSREEKDGRRRLLAAGLGFVAGLAIWTHLLSVAAVGAAMLALALRQPRILLGRLPWLALATFAAGSAPLWIANLESGFATVGMVSGAGHGRSLSRAAYDLAVLHGPKLLGVRDLVGAQEILLPPLGHAVALAFLLAVAWALVRVGARAVEGFAAREPAIGPEILVFLAAILLGLDLPSRYGTWNTERYLLPAYGAILPLVAHAVVAFTGGRPVRAALLAVGYGAVVIRGAASLHAELVAPERWPLDLPAAVDFMEKQGIRYALADHGEALVNTYRSGERVVLRDFGIGRYPLDEIPDWRIEAFLVRGDGEAMQQALGALGVPARVQRFERHALVHDLRPQSAGGEPLAKHGWRAHASDGGTAAYAVDGDLATRWGSERAQAAGMFFEIDLGGDTDVTGVRLDAGKFKTDTPRGLRIEGREGNTWRPLVEILRPQLGLFVEGGEVRKSHTAIVEARFAPRRLQAIRFVQTGADSRYDWSIAEADVFGAVSSGKN